MKSITRFRNEYRLLLNGNYRWDKNRSNKTSSKMGLWNKDWDLESDDIIAH